LIFKFNPKILIMRKEKPIKNYEFFFSEKFVPDFYKDAANTLLTEKEWRALAKSGIRDIFIPIYGAIELALKKKKGDWIVVGYKEINGVKIGYYHQHMKGFKVFPYEKLENLKREVEEKQLEAIQNMMLFSDYPYIF